MAKNSNLSGLWHSTYHYKGSKPAGEFNSEHDVKIYRTGNHVVIQSEPNEEGSYIFLRLTADGRIFTGTWEEETSPTGFYEGAVYYGAIQLIMDESGDVLHGKWVGFNRKTQAQSGDWKLERLHKV